MKTLCIFSGYVAGVLHSKPNMSYVHPGGAAILLCEPHNSYDPNAIRVDGAPSQKLGYIPREATYSIHKVLQDGFSLRTEIAEVSDTKYKEILVRVYVEVKE